MLTHFTICGLLIIIFRLIRKRKQNSYDLAEDKKSRVLGNNGDEVANSNIHGGKQPFFEMHFSDN
jgi:hypothetical protein